MTIPSLPTQGSTDWYPYMAAVDTAVRRAASTEIDVKNAPYSATGDGSTNDKFAIQAALTAAGTAGGGTVLLALGTFVCTTTLVVPADVELRIAPSATLKFTVAAQDGVQLSARSRLVGGGDILSPATWDGTNVAWTYAVVKLLGDDGVVEDITLINVPKVGIAVKDVDNPRIVRCRVTGNYPASQWTEVETVHFGIVYDASASTASGNGIIAENTIKSCVQGAYIHNYSAGYGTGLVIATNTFNGCHNHGVYIGGGWSAVSVIGNSFAQCSRPVTAQGTGHNVSCNTMWTQYTGSNLDSPGIAIREATDTICSNNVLKGDGRTGFVVIDVQNNSGVDLIRNKVTDNVIDVTGGSVIGIRVGTPPQTTNARDNVIRGNTVVCSGSLSDGAIAVYGAVGGLGQNNTVTDNDIVVRGPQNAISLSYQDNATVDNNRIRWEYDSGTAITVGGVALSVVTNSHIVNNKVWNPPEFGTNVTIRGIWEKTGSSGNSVRHNRTRADLTKLTAATSLVLLSGSSAIVEQGGTGVPTIIAGIGSRYFRTDGGTGSTLYVKESGTDATGWVAK